MLKTSPKGRNNRSGQRVGLGQPFRLSSAKPSPISWLGRTGLLLLALNLLLVACSTSISSDTSNSSSSSSNQLAPVVVAATTVKSSSVGGSHSGKKAGPDSIYPNPNLTPGDTFPGVTAKEVCVSGYSSSVRSVSSAEKAAVYQRYGMPDVPGKDEVDHFISLELGGSNDLKNLWPEPYAPTPGAHEKDKVENALHAQVCGGKLTLAEAQQIIREDWYAYYLQIENGSSSKN